MRAGRPDGEGDSGLGLVLVSSRHVRSLCGGDDKSMVGHGLVDASFTEFHAAVVLTKWSVSRLITRLTRWRLCGLRSMWTYLSRATHHMYPVFCLWCLSSNGAILAPWYGHGAVKAVSMALDKPGVRLCPWHRLDLIQHNFGRLWFSFPGIATSINPESPRARSTYHIKSLVLEAPHNSFRYRA